MRLNAHNKTSPCISHSLPDVLQSAMRHCTRETGERRLRLLKPEYRSLFRYDESTQEIYILAGKSLQVAIPPSGRWRFIDEA